MSQKVMVRALVVSALVTALWPASIVATTCTTVATSEVTDIGRSCGLDYPATEASDDVTQCLAEEKDGAPFVLNHMWLFENVPAGALSLTYEGHTCNSNDSFQLGWTDDPSGGTFTTLTGAAISSCTDNLQSITLATATTSGDIGIGVWDTQGAPDNSRDKLRMDYLAVVSSPVDTCPSMDYATGPGTIIGGSVGSLCSEDQTYEAIQETLSGGASHLKQVWKFLNIPLGNKVLCIAGTRQNNVDGDDYQFGYNTTGGAMFLTVTGAIINGQGVSGCFDMNADSVSGTVYVAVFDDAGGPNFDIVSVDKVVIRMDPVCN